MKKATRSCSSCPLIVPTRCLDKGWLKTEITYADGSKRTYCTCPECRNKMTLDREATPIMARHSDGQPQEIGS